MALWPDSWLGRLAGRGPGPGKAVLRKFASPVAADVCRRFESSPDAAALLTGTMESSRFLRALLRAGHHRDAALFLAHGLPRREAVWWGCRCARTDPDLAAEPASAAALARAEEWVAEPDQAHREEARRAARAGTYEMPGAVAAWLATAAAASTGSLDPPGQAEGGPANEGLTAHAVAGAVLLAAARDEKRFRRRFRRFMELALQVADEPAPWDAPSDSDPDREGIG